MTRLETAAWKGFQDFWKEISGIWTVYKKYGDIVLEKDLEKGEEKFKKLFTESGNDVYTFAEKVFDHWKKEYHFVANNYEEMINLVSDYKQRKNEKGHLSLLPEDGTYREKEVKGYEQTYSIRKSLYDEIVAKTKAADSRQIILINKEKESVFVVRVSVRTTGSYDEIIVSECNKSDTIII